MRVGLSADSTVSSLSGVPGRLVGNTVSMSLVVLSGITPGMPADLPSSVTRFVVSLRC